jgi:hypothetical protein
LIVAGRTLSGALLFSKEARLLLDDFRDFAKYPVMAQALSTDSYAGHWRAPTGVDGSLDACPTSNVFPVKR